MVPGTLLGHPRRPRGSRRQSREVFGGLGELEEYLFGRFLDLTGVLVNAKSKKVRGKHGSRWRKVQSVSSQMKLRAAFAAARNSLDCNLFFGVGGIGRRPLESADPVVRRAGVLRKNGSKRTACSKSSLMKYSRGLRPLPPTPKKQISAQRILRCGKSSAQFHLRRHALYLSLPGTVLPTSLFGFGIQKNYF